MSASEAETARPAKRQRLQEWCQAPGRALKSLLDLRQERRHKAPRLCVSEVTISHEEGATQIATPAATPGDGTEEPSWLEDANELPCTGVISGPSVGRHTFAGSLKLHGDQFVLAFAASKPQIALDLHSLPSQWLARDDESPSLSLKIALFTQDTLLKVLGSHRDEDLHAGHSLAAEDVQLLADMGDSAISLQSAFFEIAAAALDKPCAVQIGDITIGMSFFWDHDLSSSTFEKFTIRTSNQPLSPISTATEPEKRSLITYIWQDITHKIVQDLTCPLCDKARRYATFRRLHLHLAIHHDHFRVDVEHVPDTRCDRKIVRLDLADRKPGKANIHSDDLDFGWIAPRKPFSIDAYLAGDPSWTGVESEPPRRGRRAKSQQRRQPAYPGLYRRLPPAEVPELTPIPKKAHAVPEVTVENGRAIEFFRTNSKRPFEDGELVWNSDDEVDDSWIKERRRQHLNHLKLPEGKARFMADWDSHIDVEEIHGMSGDMLKRDSAIRFARQYRQQALDDADYRAGWQSKILRWQKWNIFDQADVDYCMQLLRPTRCVMTEPLARRSLDYNERTLSAGKTQAMDSTQQRSQLAV